MTTRPAGASRRELRVLPSTAGPWRSSALGAVTAIPWCCVLPTALTSLGLAASLLGPWVGAAMPGFFLASLGFLARAHYLIWIKGHGSPTAKTTALVLTAAAVWIWALRLAPWMGWTR